MYRALLLGISLLALPVIVIGIVMVVSAAAAGYMVAFGGASPGEPIYLDELAPTLRSSVMNLLLGVAAVALGLWGRAYARRKRRAVS